MVFIGEKMSGGHFNDNGYIYYALEHFADELENEVQNNKKKDDWGQARNYKKKTLDILKAQIKNIRKMAKILRDIDYLYSDDINEIELAKRIAKAEEESNI